jgi:thiol:disulfide interchange protein DsbD
MNKIFSLFTLLTVFTLTSFAQILDPIQWSTRTEKISDDEVMLIWEARLEPGWHLYSQHIPEGGPVPTEFAVLEASGLEPYGEVMEGTPIEEYDPNFMMELKYFGDKAVFKQKAKITGTGTVTANGEILFMVCDETQCLPPDYYDFSFSVKTNKKQISEEPKSDAEPEEEDAATAGVAEPVSEGDTASLEAGTNSEPETEANAEAEKTEAAPERKEKQKSLLGIFILSFLGGFAALLTPCVFPMIPMTVSFFTKMSKSRAKGISNAILYGIFIIGIYTLLGFLITMAFGPDALNALSTNIWFNLIFFVLLMVFAISFLGAFEITLPASWINKADRAADSGGVIGIFFMALTLGLVSFSCTGPIIGTLLVEAAVHGDVAGPLTGMFGFSLALALPFMLFAMFPGWLNSLPQSGGWLNSVKVVLGFLELGLAFKFLSNADLVVQAGLLKREIFIAIWIAVGIAITLYLFGFIRLPHDSKTDRIGVGRAMLATFFLAFTIYLVPGMWGAPLKLISGFPPPLNYSDSPNGFGSGGMMLSNQDVPEHADLGVHNLVMFHDFEHGLEYAKKVNKPIMLDFTGHACVNCRKMEEQVWSDPRVMERLQNDVVLISLYVDEKTRLPEEEHYVSEITGKKVRSVGNKWSEFQAKHYNSNSQPMYVIIGHDSMEPLLETTAYDTDIDYYINWLERGVAEFEKQNP